MSKNNHVLITPEAKEEFRILFGKFVELYLNTPEGKIWIMINPASADLRLRE